MRIAKSIVLIFVMFVSVGCSGRNSVKLQTTCSADGLSLTITFQKPFNGTVFADGYYSDPECSTPNMLVDTINQVKLNLPLLKCGTKVRMNRIRNPLVRNVIVIQHHHMLSSSSDFKVNVSCRLPHSLPRQFRLSYRQKHQPQLPYFDSWVEFQLGDQVFGEKESQLLGVGNKLFLVVFVKDGGRHKDLQIRSCVAHNSKNIEEYTSVLQLSSDSCVDRNSLNEFSLIPNTSVSDMIAFVPVKSFNISTRDGLYITCGLDLCDDMCPADCFEDQVKREKHWSVVTTHKIAKRSDNSEPINVRALEARNNLLRATIRILTDRLTKLKLQQNSSKNDSDFEKRALERFKSGRSAAVLGFNSDDDTSVVPSTERILLFDTTAVPNGQPLEETSSTNEALLTELVTIPSNIAETNKSTSGTLTEVAKCGTDLCASEYLVSSTIENSSSNGSENNTMQLTQSSTVDDALLLSISTTGNYSDVLNVTESKLLVQDTKLSADCVPRIKFIVVTASLSILAFCLLLIIIGLILKLRQEDKKHQLDSYLLYSFF